MEQFFKSIIDQDKAPIVVCGLDSKILYMNPASVKRYHGDLTGQNLKNCHNAESNAKIDRVLEWFAKSENNNVIYISRSDKENRDVYMVALRDESGVLIGYYEKHEYRNRETAEFYDMK